MEKQQIPNGTLVLVMGILSILGSCCYGIPGLIFGIVAVVMGNKATKIYNEAPENYVGFGNVKAGKIMGIIGLILSIIFIIYIIVMVATVGPDNIMNMYQDMLEAQGS